MSNPPALDMPAAERATLATLVDQLTDRGVTLPSLERYKVLKATATNIVPPPMEPLQDPLTLDPEALTDYAQRAAVHYLISNSAPGTGEPAFAREILALSRLLDEALEADLRANVSTIIAQLRKPFDAAAAGIKKAVELGIKPEDDIRSLFEAAGEVRTAWLATHHHARALDELLTIRQALSFVAHVEPNIKSLWPSQLDNYTRGFGSGIDWTVTVSNNPDGPRLDPFNPQAPWQRWLKLGTNLELTDPAGMTPFDSLRASNPERAAELVNAAKYRPEPAAEPEPEPEPEPDGRKTSSRPAVTS